MPETEIGVEVKFDPTAANAAALSVFKEVYSIVASGEWVNWTNEQQLPFITFMHKLYNLVDVKLLPPFNKSVWDGQDEGKVVETFSYKDKDTAVSTRARRNPDADKPGRKTTPKTTEDIFESL